MQLEDIKVCQKPRFQYILAKQNVMQIYTNLKIQMLAQPHLKPILFALKNPQ